ncbi:lysophospholipase [Paenibacillus helianthi]|uniref:Lysophospholipase n=1 Tax=Paenibacillus helianthi TaxID=1349432 RepID=A0ABX3ENS0_9BACL|nr:MULTISPECIES: GDSL-type esterase/lipase family protein [Paenibacillus]OKP82368.1 lysophospholipase [Paenibacillus sp. P3E]OKP84533.1 lysophospholipase [Paenibacillus sp. P32E]OKP86848.1 lysophospholipase [Paenibacillus helianthi]
MNDSKWTWRAVSLISIAATIILLVGFVYAVKDVLYPKGAATLTILPEQTAAPVSAAGETIRIVALGDSLAKGTGDNEGSGYVKRTLDGLTAKGSKTSLIGNMGINGLTTAGLQSKLQQEGVKYALRQSNVILVSIGGNDLFRGADLLGSGSEGQQIAVPDTEGQKAGSMEEGTGVSTGAGIAEGNDKISPDSLLAALPEAAKRLNTILERISEINPEAQIYYLGLYNPFGDVPELLVPGNQAVTAWNNAAMDIINKHSNMTLVPTFDLFNRHLDKYLSSDHFHPNGNGYQRISERVIQALQ